MFGLPMVSSLACKGTTSITSGGAFMYCIWETKPQTMLMMMDNFLLFFGDWRWRGATGMIKITKTKIEWRKEEDINAGGTDIPDKDLLHLIIEQMITTTMILQLMKKCRLGITRWKNFRMM